MRSSTYAVVVAALLLTGGCASQDKDDLHWPDPRSLSGDKREWWDVYSVEFRGDRKTRERVGYLYRKWDSQHPQGIYWVLDQAHTQLGFMLPDFKAYLSQNGKLQLVGTTDLLGGVKRILQVAGTVELEKVPIRPSSLQPAPGSTAISSSSR